MTPTSDSTPRARYDEIAEDLTYTHQAQAGKMFGMSVLKINGKAFAGLYEDAMNFKLSGDALARAKSLSGAANFDPMGGRPMKEWVLVPFAHADQWPALAQAALAYVQRLNESK